MLKRIISMMLAATLVATQAEAVNTADELFKSLGATSLQNNLTGFQEFRGANGEMVYGFGGSLVLKRPTPVYPQLYHIQAPEISASCSGISFKGMFGTVVNLDELERQFSEAGESLAYGILVGIIYSLPGVAEIFAKLDSWAKKIQQMLANSCRTGIAIGKAAGNEGFAQIKEAAGGIVSDDAKLWYNKVGKDYGSVIDDVDKVLGCAASVSEWIGAGSCADLKKESQNILAENYISVPSILAAAAYNFMEQNGNTLPLDSHPGTFKENDPKTTLLIRTGAAGFNKDLALVSLITSVTGDVVISYRDYIALKNGVTDAFKSENDRAAISPEQRKKSLKNLKEASEGIYKYACEKREYDENMAGEVIDYMIMGKSVKVTSDSNVSGEANVSISGPAMPDWASGSFTLPQFAVFETPDSPTRGGRYFIINYSPEVTGPFASGIQGVFDNYEGIYKTAVYAKDCYLHDDSAACTKVPFSLFDLNEQKFMAKVYRNTRDTGERNALSSKFIDYAVYHMAYALTERIHDTVRAYSDRATKANARKSTGNSSKNSFAGTKMGKCVSVVRGNAAAFVSLLDKKVEAYLEKMFEGHEPSVAGIYAIFVEQNRINMKRALERMNRK